MVGLPVLKPMKWMKGNSSGTPSVRGDGEVEQVAGFHQRDSGERSSDIQAHDLGLADGTADEINETIERA
jgi:hypothetical protein